MIMMEKRYTWTSLPVAAAAITLILFSCHSTAQGDQGAVQAPPTQGSDAVDESEVINVVKDLIVQAEKCKVISESLGNGPDITSCKDHYSRGMDLLTKAVTDLQDNKARTLNEHLKNAGSEFNACYQGIKDKDNSPLIPLTESLQKEVEECMGKLKVDVTGELTFIPVLIPIPAKGAFSMNIHHSHSGKASASAGHSTSRGGSGSGSASGSGGGSGSGDASGSGGGSGSGDASGSSGGSGSSNGSGSSGGSGSGNASGSGGGSGSGNASGSGGGSGSSSSSRSSHASSSSSASGSSHASSSTGGGVQV